MRLAVIGQLVLAAVVCCSMKPWSRKTFPAHDWTWNEKRWTNWRDTRPTDDVAVTVDPSDIEEDRGPEPENSPWRRGYGYIPQQRPMYRVPSDTIGARRHGGDPSRFPFHEEWRRLPDVFNQRQFGEGRGQEEERAREVPELTTDGEVRRQYSDRYNRGQWRHYGSDLRHGDRGNHRGSERNHDGRDRHREEEQQSNRRHEGHQYDRYRYRPSVTSDRNQRRDHYQNGERRGATGDFGDNYQRWGYPSREHTGRSPFWTDTYRDPSGYSRHHSRPSHHHSHDHHHHHDRHHDRHHHHGHHHHGGSHSHSSSSSSEEDGRGNREHESVPYNVTCVSPDGYELRQYEEAVWATTLVNDSSSSYFHVLYRYISGENDQSVKIPMTTPVRKQMLRRHGGRRRRGDVFVSASFYLPREFWDNPPVPRDERVFLERISSSVFASNFSGWADSESTDRHYEGLHGKLQRDGHAVVEGEYDVQCYNPPWQRRNRHNEILIEVDTDFGPPTCEPQPPVTEEPPNGIRQCRNRECPSYNVAATINDTVVIREVGPGVYATKKSTTCNMSNAMDDTYMPLRQYFMGENVEGVTIPTTVPVLQLAVKPDRTESPCNFTYQSSFYLPTDYQTEPPTPSDESIVISEEDPALYYVMTFHESPTTRVAFQKYNDLKQLITETGGCYLSGEFRLAYYDAPFRPLPHRYEMWIPADVDCNAVEEEEDFDEEAIPFDVEGNVVLPLVNAAQLRARELEAKRLPTGKF